ncbi:MAG: hypothetical protein M3R70_08485 [Actinomycetota bacterium]|nr:hypothetical protein [Actinomycetota bacterium]
MGAREKIRESAAPFVEQGETIQAVFNAQTGPNPNWVFLTPIIMFFAKYVVVVVTDRRILILRASAFRPTVAKSVAGELPRRTKLGPLSGLWGSIDLDGTRYWVHRRFFKDVDAADAASSGAPEAEPASAS